ncbi:hypothetical protein ACFSO0_03715 [Brevibacillus sp. GCM10020057]|uniref:hypothetical protein n=1 Tax=Brevibacillus sp. GCM10020057 TaxID=3317327 RepID=UPI00362AD992
MAQPGLQTVLDARAQSPEVIGQNPQRHHLSRHIILSLCIHFLPYSSGNERKGRKTIVFKRVNVFIVFVLFLLVVACSSNEWSYRFGGKSENWDVVTEITPDPDNGARFVGKISHLSEEHVNLIKYEAAMTNTSRREGKIENPVFHSGYMILFQDFPNTESARKKFENGVTEEEIKQFFGDYPVYKITWINDQGDEKSETIPLKFEEPKQ